MCRVIKKCNKCSLDKSLDCFYKHRQTIDGHLSECKDCVKLRVISREIEKRGESQ